MEENIEEKTTKEHGETASEELSQDAEMNRICYGGIQADSPEEFLEKLIAGKQPLDAAETLLSLGYSDRAQECVNQVKEKSGRKYYIQSEIYGQKRWYNEQRKQLKKAVKAEPDNKLYKNKLEELEKFSKTPIYKKANRDRMLGDAANVCAEGCCEGSIYCCCAGICESICNGC